MALIITIIAGLVTLWIVFFWSEQIDRSEADIPPGLRNVNDLLRRASQQTGVPFKILQAVVWTEVQEGIEKGYSKGRLMKMTGSSGEVGIMQLKPGAVEDVQTFLGVDVSGWRVDPWKNILVGAYYLKLKFSETGLWFNTSGEFLTDAFEAYNEGLRGSRRDRGTDEYTMKIMARAKLLGYNP